MSDDEILAMMRKQFDENDAAFAYYGLLKSQRKLNSVLLAQLRCRQGCTLLDVFHTPKGPAFHVPRYKLSPEINTSSSSDDGRRTNTVDGDRHWKEHGGMLYAAHNFSLNCDHIRFDLEKEDLVLGTPGKPKRRVLL